MGRGNDIHSSMYISTGQSPPTQAAFQQAPPTATAGAPVGPPPPYPGQPLATPPTTPPPQQPAQPPPAPQAKAPPIQTARQTENRVVLKDGSQIILHQEDEIL